MRQFNGTIADKKLSDFTKLDYINVQNFKDRKDVVTELVEDNGFTNEFFSTYFENYYGVSPSQDGRLAEEDAVCKTLEILGTYLIESRDVKSHRKVEYRFWNDKREFNKSMEANNVNVSLLQKSVDKDVEVIDMFVDRKNSKNQKIVKDISIQAKDLKEIKEINELQNAIDYLKSDKGISDIQNKVNEMIDKVDNEDDLTRLKYIQRNTERYLAKYVSNLKECQVMIKKIVKRPIEFKNPLKDEGAEVDWLGIIDLNNKKCIKVLLESLSQRDLYGDDFQLILWDLYEFITNKLKLSKREMEVIQLFDKGFRQVDICKELNTNKQNVATYVSRIIKKIQDSGYDIE